MLVDFTNKAHLKNSGVKNFIVKYRGKVPNLL